MTARDGSTSMKCGAEVTFTFRDESYPVVNVSEQVGCSVGLLETIGPMPEDDGTINFLYVDDGRSEEILEAGRESPRTHGARLLHSNDGETLLELRVHDSIAETVADVEGVLLDAVAEGGACELTVFLPPGRDPSLAVDTMQRHHPVVTVTALTERPIAVPFLSGATFESLLRDLLTDRQWEVLSLAHENGYFERPRQIHQDDIASRLDISQETVSQHLRAGQRRLLSTVFEEVLVHDLEL